jgi:hypothetical protein
VLFAAVFTIAIKMAPDRKPFVNPKIVAEAYVWPIGCKIKKYASGDKISKNCLIEKYYIGDCQNWGWPRGTKWPYYYRVGDDAVMVTDVISGIIMSDQVTIYEVINGIFIVEGSKNE